MRFLLRQESTESLSNFHISPLRDSQGNLSVRSDSSSPMTFDSGYESFLSSLCVIIFLNYILKLKSKKKNFLIILHFAVLRLIFQEQILWMISSEILVSFSIFVETVYNASFLHHAGNVNAMEAILSTLPS